MPGMFFEVPAKRMRGHKGLLGDLFERELLAMVFDDVTVNVRNSHSLVIVYCPTNGYKQYLNKEKSPAGKETMIKALKFELFTSITDKMFFYCSLTFTLDPFFA